MGSSTRVILPIALLFGVIFGITFISNNTNTPTEAPKPFVPQAKRVEPLLFGISSAEPNPLSSNPALRDMRIDWEVGIPGHFDFWFQNPNPEEVQIFLQGKSCTCAGAKLAVIPQESTTKSLQLSSIGILGNPLQSMAMLPFAAAELTKDLNWVDMSMENESDRKMIPGAKGNPQWGILRVTFSNAKPSEQKRITAAIMSTLPNGVPSRKELSVMSRVGSGLSVFARFKGGPSMVDFGVIHPYESATRDVYLFSFTRPEMSPRVAWLSKEDTDPCLTFTPPVPVIGSEFDEVVNLIDTEFKLGPVRILSMSKITVTLRERIEEGDPKKIVHRMEMGPFEKLLIASLGDSSDHSAQRIPIRGTIRGELRVVSGTDERDRIDFGKTVNALTGETREVEIRSDKVGLDAELLPELTSPPYLQVEMTLKGEQAGRKSWNLKVRIPPQKLNGSFPADSAIIIKLKDGSNHRIRIPVIGQALEGSRQL